MASNTIAIKDGNFSKSERSAIGFRLQNVLEDSMKVSVSFQVLGINFYKRPPVYDSASAQKSAENMRKSLVHIGYYHAKVNYNAKVSKKRKTFVNFDVFVNKPTVVDTLAYYIRNQQLDSIAQANIQSSIIEAKKPVTKNAVLGELSRLVNLYRENGYYKFTADELKMRGDTSLEALTTISDDPFGDIGILADLANSGNDTPKIKLAVVLNTQTDPSKLIPYKINKVFVYPDFYPTDSAVALGYTIRKMESITLLQHTPRYLGSFIAGNIFFKKGEVYKQSNYLRTLSALGNKGVWQNTNIAIKENKDSTIDIHIELIPNNRFAFESGIELSYTANTNNNNATTVNAGNLLGASVNVVLSDNNLGREAIRMTNKLSTGLELNLGRNTNNTNQLVNANDVSFFNTITFPRFILPFRYLNKKEKYFNKQSFINTNLAYTNRINFFNLQTTNISIGAQWSNKRNQKIVLRPFNFEYARLFNQSESFKRTLDSIPFLRYSFNTSFVAGAAFSFTQTFTTTKQKKVAGNPDFKSIREHVFNLNVEQSGFPYKQLGLLKNIIRSYVKFDAQYTFSSTNPKSAFVFKTHVGIGLSSKSDSTLPFFKQFFGGGANSMRAWPIRGIGRGSQSLIPFDTENRFNDRTGDMQFESNLEYRFDILPIKKIFTIKGVLFTDIGNIWNLRNSASAGRNDSTKFEFKNFYKELGVAAGTGLRLDFNYFLLRFDIGFRIKRPELSYINDGWKLPNIGFDNVFDRLFGRNNKAWRYENTNFTIGLSYPF